MAANRGDRRPRPQRPEGLPGLGGFPGVLAPRKGLLRALRAPLVRPGVVCLAARLCGGCLPGPEPLLPGGLRAAACPGFTGLPWALLRRVADPPGPTVAVLAWGEGATAATAAWEASRGSPVKGKGTKPNQGGLC